MEGIERQQYLNTKRALEGKFQKHIFPIKTSQALSEQHEQIQSPEGKFEKLIETIFFEN